MEQALKSNQPAFKVPTTMVEALELALETGKTDRSIECQNRD